MDKNDHFLRFDILFFTETFFVLHIHTLFAVDIRCTDNICLKSLRMNGNSYCLKSIYLENDNNDDN